MILQSVNGHCGSAGWILRMPTKCLAVESQQADDRRDYGEARLITVGFLHARMVVVVWTPRGTDRHVISMRKANEREKARYGRYFEIHR